MPITTAKNQEEFDELVRKYEVVVVLFCAKFKVPIDVMKAFGRMSLKISQYKFCYIDLKERQDISAKMDIPGDYAISVYKNGSLAHTFTIAHMEFYSCLTTMDKNDLDDFVKRAGQNNISAASQALVDKPPSPVRRKTPVQSAGSGSATITIGGGGGGIQSNSSHTIRTGGGGDFAPTQTINMPTPYGVAPHLSTPNPMYVYSNYIHPPHSTINMPTPGPFVGNITPNPPNPVTSDNGHLVGNQLSELIAVKIAEKISSQGGVPPSGSMNVSVNVDVNVKFQ
ncbi:hypothetical protein GGI11_004893 [Coemansia sp. RSA 2049]|nr:hypothetical protein GGI11_004893 [Coemansia sp. RSA 2049]KAJ2516442.1 hypothetical protein H4217_004577 [Coemansia sp. RSA 1939]